MYYCCRDFFPIIDIATSLGKSLGMSMGNTTMNVSVSQYNAGALVLAITFPPQFTPCSKYYAIKTILFCQDIVKRGIKLPKIDTVEKLG